ncbi:MAG: phosphoribosylanthranilate isomerase [Deltaproteobacteria bacterium]|nr:phosphoribosylanthranilate isomerase [Deltaproteobacteria bacterium]
MIQVKICGITRPADALCAAENGAAAVGFIFYAPSPRYIDPAAARMIISGLPPALVRVGVFVNETAAEVKRIYDYCGLDMIQLHGDESPEYCRQFPKDRLIKALELRGNGDLKRAASYEAAAILADSRRAGLYGGTGKTADWDLASRLFQPLILSGGLNEENVVDAIKKVRPSALDIASGVESAAGKKDHEKIARFMRLIHQAGAAVAATAIFTRREIV